MNLQIVFGADHTGFDYKNQLIEQLAKQNYILQDCGAFTDVATAYPVVAHAVAQLVQGAPDTYGILVGGNGNGMAMTANKHEAIRAALCWDIQVATIARQYYDANILCIPAQLVAYEEAAKIVVVFLTTQFQASPHRNIVEQINL